MNGDALPAKAIPAPEPSRAIPSEPPTVVRRVLIGLGLTVATFDLCFWQVNSVGLSLGFMALVLGVIIFSTRDDRLRDKSAIVMLLLLIGAVGATMLETSTSNTLVLLSLIIALAGESHFQAVGTLFARMFSQILALVLAPGRVIWLGARLAEFVFGTGLGRMSGLVGGVLLALPALFLALVFGSLLSTGNAVFADWTRSFFDWFWHELALVLNPARIIMWLFVALLALPLLRPSNLASKWWSPGEWSGRLPEIIPNRGAAFASGLILVVLNLLFVMANVADILFLWSGESLPKGVTYSGFVHNGTNALTWTVLLSAVVLTAIFQQSLNITKLKWLRGLALLWVAQNLFLLMSVGMRLKLYIEAYDMTVLRLSVIIFLLLVAVGYGLLTIKILQDRSLSWLLGGCVLAVFATFYITQFLDLGGWSANYNVAQWEKDRTKQLDLNYLYGLGLAAWPALRHAMDLGGVRSNADDRWDPLASAQLQEATSPLTQFDLPHWREFSLRAWMNRRALDEKTP